MARLLLLLALLLLPSLSAAQEEDDRGYLTRLLETNLSGLGREVRIDGFRGALSSRATFTSLSIADAQGVWITITDGAIRWNRAALLSGRVDIAEMTAARIELTRSPRADEGPAPEARRFALPELPVSVSIGTLRADEVRLNEVILGQEVTLAVEGAAQLAGGEGSARLQMRRTDGRLGEISFEGAFANSTRVATLDLLAREGSGGIVANLVDLPGQPDAEFALHGSGPIDNFVAEIALTTEGTARLTGRVEVATDAAPDGTTPRRRFKAAFSGDLRSLMQPAYHDFFGSRTILEAEGEHLPGKRTDLTRLALESDGLDIRGRLGLSAERVPLAAALTIRLGLGDREELLLPVPGGATFAQAGVLRLRFDAERGDEWGIEGNLSGFRRPGMAIDTVTLRGSGRILSAGTGAARILGSTEFKVEGLGLDDPALASAAGQTLKGQTAFVWQEGDPLRLQGLTLAAGDLDLSGDLSIGLDGIDPVVSSDLSLRAANMARFSLLADRTLGGSGHIQLSGSAGLLSQTFDLRATVTGTGLSVDHPVADRVLAKGSRIDLAARRDETGIMLDQLDVVAAGLNLRARGQFTSIHHRLNASLAAPDLSVLGEAFGGSVTIETSLSGLPGARSFDLSGTADDLRLVSGPANRLLQGRSKLVASLRESDGRISLSSARLNNPALQLDVLANGPALEVTGRIADLGQIAPGVSGPLTLKGQVSPGATLTDIRIAVSGPGETRMDVAGNAANDLSKVNVSVGGTAQAALLNSFIAPRSITGLVQFDLLLSGPPTLDGITGQVVVDDLHLASPNERISVDRGRLEARLGGGRAVISGEVGIQGGGRIRISGPVTLAPPFDAAIGVEVDGARLRDPSLYTTTVSGSVTVTGPLLGGAVIGGSVTLSETEIVVAAPGFRGGEAPYITHVNEPLAVRQTRARAGLLSDEAGRRQSVFGLDLTVSAPQRIFVRGLGLDAELGGTVQLRGTTESVIPVGRFELIRGRFNLLGRRFVLDDGLVQLQGSLVPYLYFSASSDTFGSTATVILEGPADSPEVHFISSTGLPEEEVIALLLFGDGLNDLSTFQLVQLANAVATLAGQGGVDIVSRLRRNLDLDDLDIVTDEDGNSALRAGRHLSDRVYSEISAGSEGTAKAELEFDLNFDFRLRGTLGTDGESGIGIYFDRNY